MKPIFGIDVTSNKNNEELNGNEFITRAISAQTQNEFNEKTENFEKTVNKSDLPLWLRIIKFICGFYAVIVAGGTIKALPDVTLEQAFKNAPGLIISGLVCGVAWLVLFIIAKKKEKTVLAEEKADEQIDSIKADIDEIYKELGVPAGAEYVDILVFRYAVKDGEIKVKALPMQTAEYFNMNYRVFVKDECLHIANLDGVYSFKLSELQAIKTVNKRISMMSWNKELGPTEEKYKPYKLTVNQFDNVFVKPYHILTLAHDGEDYGIYFPSYELDNFEVLTGLKAEE